MAYAGAMGTNEIEAPIEVIEWFNRGKMDKFRAVGFYTHENIKVYEAGKKEEAKRLEERSVDEVNFPNDHHPKPSKM